MLGRLFKGMRSPQQGGSPAQASDAGAASTDAPASRAAPAPSGGLSERAPVRGSAFLREALRGLPLISVLDVGAMMLGNEEAPYQPLIDGKVGRVVGFEPDPAECDKLNREIGAPHLFLPHFIGDGGPATYYETNVTLTGSLYKPNLPLLNRFTALAEFTQPVAEHAVATRRLDDIPEVGAIDYVKIDVQGGELKVFEGGVKTLASTLVIHTEVEFVAMYEKAPLFADVDRFLRAQGFQLHTFWGFGQRAFRPVSLGGDGSRGIHQMLWSDVIYVRDWMHMEALSEEQLKKYALLMDMIYGSKDLCCALLEHLDARTGSTLARGYVDDWNREMQGQR